MYNTKELIELGKSQATKSQLASIKEEVDKIFTTYDVIKDIIKNRLLFNIGSTYLAKTRSDIWGVPITLCVYLGVMSDEFPVDFLTILPENYYE